MEKPCECKIHVATVLTKNRKRKEMLNVFINENLLSNLVCEFKVCQSNKIYLIYKAKRLKNVKLN